MCPVQVMTLHVSTGEHPVGSLPGGPIDVRQVRLTLCYCLLPPCHCLILPLLLPGTCCYCHLSCLTCTAPC